MKIKITFTTTGVESEDYFAIPCSEYEREQAHVAKLEVFKQHIIENGGCMCEREEGESQKDCEICYPK